MVQQETGFRARVFAEECFGTQDGPGIRYVCFLHGCGLNCLYCHNPEAQGIPEEPLKVYGVDELLTKVRSYQNFWLASGGGLTLSGGEPLLQARFVTQLLKKARSLGIHTAIDTAGAVPWSIAESAVRQANLILLDIKAGDPKTAWQIARLDLDLLQDFIDGLNQVGVPVWVRHVLVPEWNDDPAQLSAVAKLSRRVSNLERFEILGFHQMAKSKWHRLGRIYHLQNQREANENDLARAQRILRAYDLPVVLHERQELA